MDFQVCDRFDFDSPGADTGYGFLFAGNPVPMFIFDEETLGFLEVNAAAVRQYGWTPDQFLTMTVLDIRPPKDRAATLDTIRRFSEACDSKVGLFRHWHRDGSLLHVEVACTSILYRGRRARLCMLHDVTEREKAKAAMLRAQEELQAELADTQRLQHLSAALIHQDTIEDLYGQIVDAAVSIMGSDFASLQRLYPDPGTIGELHLLAFRGFNPQAAKFWEWVRADSESTCGVALRTRKRVIAPDVENCAFMTDSLDQATYLQAGIRAVQTTPLLSRSGKLVGMISTHWRTPHEPSERDLRLLDILARQAADLIERIAIQKQVQSSEEKYRSLFTNMTEGFALGEPILDEHGKPIDIRLLDVNDAFYHQTGLPRGILGRPAREYAPQQEPYWVDRFSAVSLTGQPDRFDDYSVDTGRHYSIYAFCPTPGKFAILFRDITQQKLAERAVQENEAYLRQLVATLPGMVWTTSPDGAVDFVSQQWLDYTGTTLESQLGAGTFAALHPEDRDRVALLWQEAVAADRDDFGVEFRLRRHDGEYRWFKSRATLLRAEGGATIRWLGILIDVDDLKQTEDALRESQKQLQSTFEQAATGIAHVGLDGRFLRTNQKLCDIVGYSPDELQSLTFQEITHPDDLDADLAEMRRLLAGDIPHYSMEKRYLRKEGGIVWINLTGSLVRGEAGKPDYFIAVIEDVTGRKSDQEELRQSKEHLAIQNDRQTLLLHVSSGILHAWGDKARLSGIIFEEVRKHLDLEVSFTYRMLSESDEMELVAAQGVAPDVEKRLQHLAMGQPFCGLAAATGMCQVADEHSFLDNERGLFLRQLGLRCYAAFPLFDLEREVIGTLSFGSTRRDRFDPEEIELLQTIAYFLSVAWERRRAEEEISRLNADLERRVRERTAELEAANQELEAFTFATSHDLRGPLGRINSFTTLLERNCRGQLEGDNLLFLDLIRQNATRLTQLVDDLLVHARVSQKTLELQCVDVSTVTPVVVREKSQEAQSCRAQVRIDLPPVQVVADAHALVQVLGNLVENAFKYSSNVDFPQVEIDGEGVGDRFRLRVRDNGIGFDMKYHDRIFQMFHRLHTYTEYPGSGVGLALVARAMQRMGGRVWAESEPGQGASFFLEFQLASNS